MKKQLKYLMKEILFHSPLKKLILSRYPFCFNPAQLSYLCQCLEETKKLKGSVAEIGCYSGYTTLFLNKFMDAQKIDKKYFAIDSFNGFVSDDIDFEVQRRGKSRSWYKSSFKGVKKKYFDESMLFNKITRVHSIQADVNNFDLTTLGTLSFVLLDLDLYRPMKKSLFEVHSITEPGGIIIVDDCISYESNFDGAYQAYTEFTNAINYTPEIILHKLGIIRKSL